MQVEQAKYRSGEHSVGYWLWGPDILDPIDFTSFLPGGKVATERNNWQLEDVPADIQELIARARTASDPDERMEVYTALQEFNQQHGPFAPFVVPEQPSAYLANLQGFIFHPHWTLDVTLLSRADM